MAKDENKTELIVTADIPGGEQESKEELALRVVDVLTEKLDVTYRLIEGQFQDLAMVPQTIKAAS